MKQRERQKKSVEKYEPLVPDIPGKHLPVRSPCLYRTVNLVNKFKGVGCVCVRMCVRACVRMCVRQSNISTVTEIQETAPSATNVATSIKFPPTKGHHREPITSESLSLARLKPLWRRAPLHLAAPANTYLHPSDKNIFTLYTNTTATAVSAEHCVREHTRRQALDHKCTRVHTHTHTEFGNLRLLIRQEKHYS